MNTTSSDSNSRTSPADTPKTEQQHPAHNMEDDDPFCIRDELLAAPRPHQLNSIGSASNKSNIVEFYKNRSVLITGASGFIGKVLIEKLLRTCPQLKRIFVLIRPKWDKQPAERLRELLEAPLFNGVRNESDLQQRVILVEGDVTQRNLGLSKTNLIRVCNEVSVIFHSAATIKFDEPLKQSIGINIAGTKNMIELCRRIPQLAALVHVSTAYANCDRYEVDEHIYPMDQLDPEKLIKMADWLDQDTLQELKRRLLGQRPNTYTYTKALAEWLLIKSARDLPVVICRPSIVVASWREPFRGWIDNVNGPTGIVLGAGKGLIRTMFAEKDYVADLVPVDTVINLLVALGWFAHLYNKNQLNEASESLTDDSLIGDSSAHCSTISSRASSSSSAAASDAESYAEDEHNNGLLTPVSLVDDDQQEDEMDEELDAFNEGGCAIRSRQEEANVNNNNNNNESDINLNHIQPVGGGGNNNEGEEDDQCKQQISTTFNVNHQLIQNNPTGRLHLDDGYGSSRSSYAHSTKSSASSSSSICLQSRRVSSTNRLDVQHLRLSASPKTNQRRSASYNQNKATSSASLDHKLRQFKQKSRAKLIRKGLPHDLADVPVFHCTSGNENPISWGQVQILVLTFSSLFPSMTTYRYPCGSFTSNKYLDNFYRLTLHYIPGYLVDWVTQLFGGKPILVKIFKKFDQAAAVLKAFTSRQWKFDHENRLTLINELMNDEDRRLFNCDVRQLDWQDFCRSYVIGVRKFMLKEPMDNLVQARRNLTIVYYRNLALQLASVASLAYYTGMFSYLQTTLIPV